MTFKRRRPSTEDVIGPEAEKKLALDPSVMDVEVVEDNQMVRKNQILQTTEKVAFTSRYSLLIFCRITMNTMVTQ